MTIVGYGLAAQHGQALARLFNETNAATARAAGTAFIPVATVPLQDTRAAVEELDYAVQSLGIRMVEIGTNVNGLNLDEEHFAPFFVRAAALDVLVQLHPHQVAAQDRLRRYYLGNLVGNPVDTTIAATSLISPYSNPSWRKNPSRCRSWTSEGSTIGVASMPFARGFTSA
jgi:aminocarboxymuconate-semialdehyde decarboxylase